MELKTTNDFLNYLTNKFFKYRHCDKKKICRKTYKHEISKAWGMGENAGIENCLDIMVNNIDLTQDELKGEFQLLLKANTIKLNRKFQGAADLTMPTIMKITDSLIGDDKELPEI